MLMQRASVQTLAPHQSSLWFGVTVVLASCQQLLEILDALTNGVHAMLSFRLGFEAEFDALRRFEA